MSYKSADHLQKVGGMNEMFCFKEIRKEEWMWKEVFMKQTINQRNQPLSTSKRENYVSEWLR